MIAIVAYDRQKAIAKNGVIPWSLQGDMMFFKKLTRGCRLVMGRKTADTIVSTLPGRSAIVLSRGALRNYNFNSIMVNTLEDVRNILCDTDINIGGEDIYSAFSDDIDTVYATEIDTTCNGDRYFPINTHGWNKELLVAKAADSKNEFNFKIYKYTK